MNNTVKDQQSNSPEAMAAIVLRVKELQDELHIATKNVERAFKVGFSIGYSIDANPASVDEYWDSVQDVVLTTEAALPSYH